MTRVLFFLAWQLGLGAALAFEPRAYVEVWLDDNSRLLGWLAMEDLEMDTAFGPLRIPADSVRDLRRTNGLLKVYSERGDAYSGVIKNPLVLQTLAGPVRLQPSALDAILPLAAAVGDQPLRLKTEELTLRVLADGRIEVLGQSVTPDQLSALLSQVEGLEPRTPIHIRADKKTQMLVVVDLFRLLPTAGYSNFRLLDPIE